VCEIVVEGKGRNALSTRLLTDFLGQLAAARGEPWLVRGAKGAFPSTSAGRRGRPWAKRPKGVRRPGSGSGFGIGSGSGVGRRPAEIPPALSCFGRGPASAVD